MSYSRTSPVLLQTMANPDAPGRHDSLFGAWQSLRRAREVPYDAANAPAWHEEFTYRVAAASHLITLHVGDSEAVDSVVRRLAASSQQSALTVAQLFDDHSALAADADRLLTSARTATTIDVVRLVELTELTVVLEMAVARHLNRLRAFLEDHSNHGLARSRPVAAAAPARPAQEQS